MKLNSFQLSQLFTCQVNGNLTKEEFSFQFLTDSRLVENPENTVFFALKTSYNDGHLFIPSLIKKGVKHFVVNHDFEMIEQNKVIFYSVDDVLKALQSAAANIRKKFNIPVIGITGSNGKTIVKEWLSYLLKSHYRICSSPKSYNSQIGVPLSVSLLEENTQLGMFEAGISKPGEMEILKQIIEPNLGILTHMGTAHDQGFSNYEQKLNEKLILFESCEKVFARYDQGVEKSLGDKLRDFDFNRIESTLNITDVISNKGNSLIKGIYKEKVIQFELPFQDDASIENACLCALVCLELGGYHSPLFSQLPIVKMRLELVNGKNNCLIVNDSYSNDLHSLNSALSFLNKQNIHPKCSVILSEIEESGMDLKDLVNKILNLLIQNNVNRLIAIGDSWSQFKDIISDKIQFIYFENTDAIIKNWNDIKFNDEAVLVKGARKFKFERIVSKLQKQQHGTVLEIDLNAALNNLELIKQSLPTNCKIMAMVKAFAYGSGSYEIAKLLHNKVDYLAVAYADEGVILRQNGIKTPIMVMNPEEDTFSTLLEYQLEPEIYSIEQLKLWIEFCEGKQNGIHIELDTGMHRLGFVATELDELIELLKKNSTVQVQSIFSHLSSSDEAIHDEFTKAQYQLFTDLANKIEIELNIKTLKHIANTAGILRFDNQAMNMVRVGIGLYGINPSKDINLKFENVFTLKTSISQIKEINEGESIGYSRKAIENKKRKIAILAIGYADGLNRLLSNGKGEVIIQNQRAKIIGNICMDMCMVDITNIDCTINDDVYIFGKGISIEELAEKTSTIPYEILTSISQRVKRVYISE